MYELFTEKVAVVEVADVERSPLLEVRLYYIKGDWFTL